MNFSATVLSPLLRPLNQLYSVLCAVNARLSRLAPTHVEHGPRMRAAKQAPGVAGICDS
jgi:hypothetical protein